MFGSVRMRAKRLLDRIARRVGRVLAEELRSEMERSRGVPPSHATGRVSIDVADALKQLGDADANVALQRFYAWNHRWVANLEERNRRTARGTYDFIDTNMGNAVFMLDQFAFLKSKRSMVSSLGEHIIDLGVHTGASTRKLAKLFPDKTIHGFDSFLGLPEDWTHVPEGTFRIQAEEIPELPDNVQLFPGWFEESLPRWRDVHRDVSIALLRVDCDVYSSTATAFDTLNDFLGPGSWVLFDELIGYRGWQGHEYRALLEFLEKRSLGVNYLAYGLTYVLVELRATVTEATDQAD